ncbi:MAG: bifunctional glutamate N-acetyltransferase/amino-acid acetyltransferase ArgJ [Dehalococcoidaceae bacterium]|nr:bifunctional glutamate N-acetyltransferase/amino-acid acetyltransferase ArgJ [Dehalococcoidaceae bacterium]
MSYSIKCIPGAHITSAKGFLAGAIYAGINSHPPCSLDLCLLYSQVPCRAAAVFTTNRVKAAPVLVCRSRVPSESIRGLVVNSGIANACTGPTGLANAEAMAALAAAGLGVDAAGVLPMSTGVIGRQLPMNKLESHIGSIRLSVQGGADFARAIMTTDTRPKEFGVRVEGPDGAYTICGAAKGAGMIAPNMATTLCFITTDALIELQSLNLAARKAADASFNMISVDGDTSTNDTLLVLANGLAGNGMITGGSKSLAVFQKALGEVCTFLARSVAADGEGATRLITVNVTGARNKKDARLAARTVASSNLVKSAVHGTDPNWGRIVAAAGRSLAELDEHRLSLKIGPVELWQKGKIIDFDLDRVREAMREPEVIIGLDLGLGRGNATAWGCDLSEEYVTINSEYTT